MSRLRLRYFNIRGRGEAIRMLLHRAKVDFEDHRIAVSDWFDNDKAQQDRYTKQLPHVTIQGRIFNQSVALMSYFATKHGLYGQSHLHQLTCDQFVQYQEQLMYYDVECFVTPDKPKKYVQQREFWDLMYTQPLPQNADAVEKMKQTIYPRFMTIFEDLILDNREQGSDVCVGNKISLADIILHVGTQTAYQIAPEVVQKFPGIMTSRQAVEEAGGVGDYLKIRPYCSL